jgi:hypothetical protein
MHLYGSRSELLAFAQAEGVKVKIRHSRKWITKGDLQKRCLRVPRRDVTRLPENTLAPDWRCSVEW